MSTVDSPSRDFIEQAFRQLQRDICVRLENADGERKFMTDEWKRPGGGGGISRVLKDGKIIEKGGVNFSAVWGKTPEATIKTLNLGEAAADFFATGVSIVLHPCNPHVPIIHMNVRYFEMSDGTWWFGGGIDLTPHYVNEADAKFFHTGLKAVCDRFSMTYYPAFKKWADDYFFIRHRNETRGVGGIFFDHLKSDSAFSKQDRFDFVIAVGNSFCDLYEPLMKQNFSKGYSDGEKQWQLLRRGRYVEFNLVWDRGTKFGLETDGRTESILMSLPPQANWEYQYTPAAGSAEHHTLSLLRKGIEWV